MKLLSNHGNKINIKLSISKDFFEEFLKPRRQVTNSYNLSIEEDIDSDDKANSAGIQVFF